MDYKFRWLKAPLLIVGCIVLFMVCYQFEINAIEEKHTIEMEEMQNILAEAQATPEPAFIRGSSKYVPSEDHTLSHSDSDLFEKFLIIESGLTEYEYPATSTTMYAIGAVIMNRVESPHFPDTIMEVLAQFPSFEKVNEFQISYSDKRWLSAIGIVDDLVCHDYRPIDKNILFYAPQGSDYDVPGTVVFETIDFRFYGVEQ